MVTEEKLDLLTEVGQISQRLSQLRQEGQQIQTVYDQVNNLRLDYQGLLAHFSHAFQELTELMLTHGLAIDPELFTLFELRVNLDEIESRRDQALLDARKPFNILGDVIEYWA